MILMVTVKGAALIAWFTAAIYSAIDPQWATPLNTLLLLVTLVAGAFLNRKVGRVEDKADRNHRTATDAASASASAAEAALTAARIAKELGGQLRTVSVRDTGDTTDATHATDTREGDR